MGFYRLPVLAALLIFFSGLPLHSQDDPFYEEGWNARFSGYYKNLFMYQERDEFQGSILELPEKKKLVSDLNRLRLSPELDYAESFIFHADIDIEAVAANYTESDEFELLWESSSYNEIADGKAELAEKENLYALAEFQNIYIKFVAGSFTGTAGRQQVRFGNSRLWNPLDLMNPFSPLSVEGSEEQPGTDALRLDWYPGESTELTLVAAPKREDDDIKKTSIKSGNYIARLKSGVKVLDVALLGGYTAKRGNAGADFTAEVFDGFLTGVVLYSKPEHGDEYYQCGTGYEYTFASGLYFLMEYFYNSLPVNDDDELSAALLYYSIEGMDGSNYYILSNRMITYNSHYASLSLGYDFFPLLRGEFFAIYDFQGRGVFLNALLKFNALDNLDLTAGVITAFIDESERESDFEVYDREPMYYASLQFYF
ncbi:MAG TPA: hypothetical protein PK358_04070 [Spirochaetota bacterium]|nr:hypothetical protein [Spirochaetota bacterium]HPJ33985.1 hypothetical protein [Spirochaetota bacterium]